MGVGDRQWEREGSHDKDGKETESRSSQASGNLKGEVQGFPLKDTVLNIYSPNKAEYLRLNDRMAPFLLKEKHCFQKYVCQWSKHICILCFGKWKYVGVLCGSS